MDKDKTLEIIRNHGDDEVTAQLDALSSKKMIPSDGASRSTSIKEVVSRLEERNLRNLKSEEVKRFSDSPPDVEDGDYDGTLVLNEQIKKNEGLRRGQIQKISS